MLTKLTSFATVGLSSEKVTVEIGATRGKHVIDIVGLGDTAVQESRQRVRMALRSSGFFLPTGQHVTVNLAPAHLRKAGSGYDLAIALGLLIVYGSVSIPKETLQDTAFLGELALDGSLRHVSGILSSAISCREHGISTIVVPEVNGPEAALVPGLKVIAARNISELLGVLAGTMAAPDITAPVTINDEPPSRHCVDFADVRGQEHAKRALEIAAAGGHNVLLCGVPGAGKTLLAKAFRGILPPLTDEESMEVTRIYSVANLLPEHLPLIRHRPFRVVHHTASGVSIVGGGQIPGPGEISLAHKGVLFLDELAEFPVQVLEVLRQPLEDRQITITRAHGSVTFPADFIMVAAMNPPEYSSGSAQKLKRRISAPLLDRIDLTIAVDAVDIDELQRKSKEHCETSATILRRVTMARDVQRKRFAGLPLSTNKEMSVREIEEFCPLDDTCLVLLKQAVQHLGLSARAYHRTIKVARTIADLAGSGTIGQTHIAEALQYRQDIGV